MAATFILCRACGLKHSERPDRKCPRCGAPAGASSAVAVCPACGLKHSPRADRRCPRCGAEGGVPGAPAVGIPAAVAVAAGAGGTAPARSEATTWWVESAAQSRARSRRAAGKALLWIGAFGLLAGASSNVAVPERLGGVLGASVDIALGALLLGDAEWPRIAAIVRCGLGLAGVALMPIVYRNPTHRTELVFLMKLCFFLGMLILLPGRAGPGRRWAGLLVALVPYPFLKILGGLEPAARSGEFEIVEFLAAFFRTG